ncbi:hypothetical protein [Brevibacillus brevis]|nr:hypothetical protein [Lysinibacillus sp. SDF0063]
MLKFQLSLISLSCSEEVELREVVQEVTEWMKCYVCPSASEGQRHGHRS